MAKRGSGADSWVELDVRIEGETGVQAMFADINSSLRAKLRSAIEEGVELVKDRASGVEMAGGVVKRKTGRMARGLVHRFYQSPTRLYALVWDRVPHFWMLSMGSVKNETMVKPHTRRVSTRDRRGILRARTGKTRTRITWARTASGIAFVESHPRKINLKPRPIMSSAFGAVEFRVRERLTSAIRAAVAEAA